MLRFQTNSLHHWKTKKERKPLILRGARQVGKTWLVRELAQSFDSFVEINLEAQTECLPLFDEYYGKPEELIPYLSASLGVRIIPGKTLLFLDEIQESPKAILSLRYFKEKLPALHVIAAGSLIEFALKELSFPVGRIEFLYVFPMTFREYLWATGKTELADQISSASPAKPLPPPLHEMSLKEVVQYSLMGGMPEVVKAYSEARDFRLCQTLQQSLVANFRADFNKYASRANIPQIRIMFDSIPRLIGQKLKYSQVSKEIRSRDLSKVFCLLEEAGLVYRAAHSSGNGVPLSSESKPEKFKAFFADIGLCQRILGLDLKPLLKATPNHRGKLAEQFVAQELIALTPENDTPRLYYWHRETKSAQAELDFLLEFRGTVVPIEVKSGTEGTLKSLNVFMREKKSTLGIKISETGFGVRSVSGGQILEIPFYGIGNIDATLQ